MVGGRVGRGRRYGGGGGPGGGVRVHTSTAVAERARQRERRGTDSGNVRSSNPDVMSADGTLVVFK